jgi:hypothetical protein
MIDGTVACLNYFVDRANLTAGIESTAHARKDKRYTNTD